MKPSPLDRLLDKLCSGDAQAAEEVFRAYAPYLRMVIRRQLPARLRAKFDSIDVVQSVWVELLEGFQQGDWNFASAEHLRAFLLKVTRNRFIDRLRHHQHALDQEQSLEEIDHEEAGVFSRLPRPSEAAVADELWQKMLRLCPPQHHQLLQLRREGKTMQQIAELTGLHPSSVRRILYDLAHQMAADQQANRSSEEEPGPAQGSS